MIITFDFYNVGLGNNGGSRTVIKCAETLSNMGHKVFLHSNIKSRYSWHKINKNVILHYGDRVPKSDVIIATGVKSVNHVLKSKVKNKFYYIRGHELWNASEENLIKSYKSLNCIVNSEWLFNYLKKINIKSKIIYPGLDFDDFYNLNKNRKIQIGGLWHKKHKTKNHNDIIKICENNNFSYTLLNKDISNPNSNQLRNWYNNINIWVSSSVLEGLHNPPMEASLCGCSLVAKNHIKGGTSDYAIHNETALLYNNLEEAYFYINELIDNNEKRHKLNLNMIDILRNKVGSREENMKKMIEYIG